VELLDVEEIVISKEESKEKTNSKLEHQNIICDACESEGKHG
jgi:hypothetical protein